MKIVLITGGSISGIGKGLIASSIGSLLNNVTFLKIDPYLNFDAGTLGPSEHGEVFVLNDGTEVDLDLGNYQRFCNLDNLSYMNTLTTGKLFNHIFQQEKDGKYLGQTIQIIPHVTDFFQQWIEQLSVNKDYVIIELGGTVGDIENTHFIASLRRLSFDIFHIHVSLVPYIQEYKTKLVQTSVNSFIKHGLTPNLIITRSDKPLSNLILKKINSITMIPTINVWNESNIYNIPYQLKDLKQFLPITIPKPLLEFSKTITINIVGKYSHQDAYHSLYQSLYLSARTLSLNINFSNDNYDGIIIPGGFGERGIDYKLEMIKKARINNIPCLGICLGMQCMILEYQKNVLNKKVISEEFLNSDNKNYDIVIKNIDSTMHKGMKKIHILNNTKLFEIYQKTYNINERFRHKYYVSDTSGFVTSATCTNPNYPAAIELFNHLFFIGVQYHPEFNSTINKPHPLFTHFLKYTNI